MFQNILIRKLNSSLSFHICFCEKLIKQKSRGISQFPAHFDYWTFAWICIFFNCLTFPVIFLICLITLKKKISFYKKHCFKKDYSFSNHRNSSTSSWRAWKNQEMAWRTEDTSWRKRSWRRKEKTRITRTSEKRIRRLV